MQRLREEALGAAQEGAEIVVFPELFLTGYTRPLDPQRAREVFAEVSEVAPDALFVFGSISETRRNRVTVWSGGTASTSCGTRARATSRSSGGISA